ncbi:hypothetical protein EPN44_04640, partial [bacterium]
TLPPWRVLAYACLREGGPLLLSGGQFLGAATGSNPRCRFHADQVSGKDCRWNTFQTPHTTWTMTHATGFSIAKELGRKWYMISPDYAYGHSLADGYTDVVKKAGGQIVGSDFAPLGTRDFSPYIPKIQSARPDVVILNIFGTDLINFVKQSIGYGMFKSLPIAGPVLMPEDVRALPEVARIGYWGIEWYYKGDLVLGKGNLEAQRFASIYRKRFKQAPTPRAVFGYVAMDRTLWAISETKSTDGPKMAKALQGNEFRSLWSGNSSFREVDHNLEWPMWFGSLRANGTVSDPDDVFDVIDRRSPAESAISDAEASKVCHLAFPS